MLDRIIELLVSLAVAVAGAMGIGTATTTPHGVGPDADSVAAKTAWAHQQAAAHRADHADETLTGVENQELAADGIGTAVEALARAIEQAPEAADPGLTQAVESVSNAAPPSDIPAGPPSDIPGPDSHPGP